MEKGKYYREITSEAKVFRFNFREVWQYRDLILLFVKRNFVSQYKQTILGPAWAVIQPPEETIPTVPPATPTDLAADAE